MIERIYTMLNMQPGAPPTDSDVLSLDWLESAVCCIRALCPQLGGWL
jgi:hypothetical protein